MQAADRKQTSPRCKEGCKENESGIKQAVKYMHCVTAVDVQRPLLASFNCKPTSITSTLFLTSPTDCPVFKPFRTKFISSTKRLLAGGVSSVMIHLLISRDMPSLLLLRGAVVGEAGEGSQGLVLWFACLCGHVCRTRLQRVLLYV